MTAKQWLRVFTASDLMPQPAAIQDELRRLGHDMPIHVRGDDLGWTTIAIPLEPPVQLERYLTEEDELRRELDSWAAAAESWGGSADLMTRLVATRQLFTIGCTAQSQPIGEALARFLASQTAAILHIDGQGFFTTEGRLLLAESPE